MWFFILLAVIALAFAFILNHVRVSNLERQHSSDHLSNVVRIESFCSLLNETIEKINAHGAIIEECVSRIETLEKSSESELEAISKLTNSSLKYSDEFKMDCINYYLSKGESLRKAAEELNLPKSTLTRWVKEFREKSEN